MQEKTNRPRGSGGVVPLFPGWSGSWSRGGRGDVLVLSAVPQKVGVLLESADDFVTVLREFEPVSAEGSGTNDEDADIRVNVGTWM